MVLNTVSPTTERNWRNMVEYDMKSRILAALQYGGAGLKFDFEVIFTE